ncbi:MAG: tetratricopeptide repeat protein [Alphaproteobacteria bacterium]
MSARLALRMTLAVAAASLSVSAHADSAVDCAQAADPAQVVAGCTAVLDSGDWSGTSAAWAYYNRANAYGDLGDTDAAFADYDRATALDPYYTDAYNNRGVLNAGLGRNEEAIADYSAAIRADPDNALAYFNRAIAHYTLGGYPDSIADYEAALAIAEGDPATPADDVAAYREGLASAQNDYAWDLYVTDSRLGEALKLVELALAVLPDRPEYLDTRAHILNAQGHAGAAVVSFEAAMAAGGADIVQIYEDALAGHGYDPGAVDGSYDAAMRAALKACVRDRCRLVE